MLLGRVLTCMGLRLSPGTTCKSDWHAFAPPGARDARLPVAPRMPGRKPARSGRAALSAAPVLLRTWPPWPGIMPGRRPVEVLGLAHECRLARRLDSGATPPCSDAVGPGPPHTKCEAEERCCATCNWGDVIAGSIWPSDDTCEQLVNAPPPMLAIMGSAAQ